MQFPHVPKQRQGENRAVRDVDDMFTLLSVLDEAGNLCELPTYVTNDPDSLPSIRLYENDFGVMMSMLEKFGSKMNLLEAAICNVAQDVHSIRSKVTSLETGRHTQPIQPQFSQYSVTSTRPVANQWSVVNQVTCLSQFQLQ